MTVAVALAVTGFSGALHAAPLAECPVRGPLDAQGRAIGLKTVDVNVRDVPMLADMPDFEYRRGPKRFRQVWIIGPDPPDPMEIRCHYPDEFLVVVPLPAETRECDFEWTKGPDMLAIPGATFRCF